MGRRSERLEFEDLEQAWGKIGKLFHKLQEGLSKAGRDAEDLDIILSHERLLERMIESIRFETRFRRLGLSPVPHYVSAIVVVPVFICHTRTTIEDLLAWLTQYQDCRFPIESEIMSLCTGLERHMKFGNGIVLQPMENDIFTGTIYKDAKFRKATYKASDRLPVNHFVCLVHRPLLTH